MTWLLLVGCAWVSDGRLEARLDRDGDGYEAAQWDGADCDDADPDVHPNAAEAWYDGVDENCDGANDFDQDGDGVLAAAGGGTDCDDTDPDVHPGAPERANGVDDDCDGATDEAPSTDDADGDGYSEVSGDCDDADAAVHPGASEIFYDGTDEDCDPTNEYDRDGDGWDAEAYGGADCDDSDPAVNPGETEIPLNRIDDDCDGVAL
jgi:hypothetical protein